MFKEKNLSPKQLAALTALLIATLIALSIFMLFSNPKLCITYFIVSFISIYFLMGQLLEYFIYRKIKLIYKLISQTKASKREEAYQKYVLPRKGIDDVREDVEEWAAQKTKEIQDLQSNEAFRKEFLQNLSHEIKTPIFAIQGYLELLDDGAMDDAITGPKFVKQAQSNVQRLVQLLNDVDSITNLEINKDPILKQSFIIQDIILEAVNNLSVKWIKKNIQFQFKKGSETPTSVFADKNKIYQVIVNILSNAAKYGKIDGQITASVYKMEDQKILIELSDDGTGIAEEHLPRLFERFYRTDDARNREIGGTGLGLAICKHIIEAHGETIHVRSKVNVGTTLGFTLASKA
ncbi:MAG: sensor histidine kinase [Chitinophagaceae bacterium]|jgi:two-component system phosphate regulon sensor histidine kinase PhoR|nr:sensor histidine kinase [Chitinophagaceae bacterium]